MRSDSEQNDIKRLSRGRPREFDREDALNSALKLFWRQGYIQTTMSQLCEAMQIKSPSLYCAFGSKAELFLEALAYYKKTFWSDAFKSYLDAEDIYTSTRELFLQAARILLLPDAPCGCMTVCSAMTLPPNEEEILAAITEMRKDTKKVFREKLMQAIKRHQIPPDSNIPAISGALTNFFEGLSLQARGDICLAELLEIAALGVNLLPDMNK